jgi:hypothetical protein
MMKLMSMLMLAAGLFGGNAFAAVGQDKSAPNCQQVIQSIQEALKKTRPAPVSSTPDQPVKDPNAGTAQ